ncbi:MAG: DUF4124 domain-containing protein [Burkholderiales bacterium]|nr:DUF4124 domain-containing protein [Burkholderiales bacterium]
MLRSTALVILVAASTLAAGQAYKWRDASGRIQYSDTPPPPGSKEVQQLRTPSTVQSATPGKAATPATDPDADFRKRLVDRQAAEAKQARAAEEEQARIRNCELARTQLATLESGATLVQFNEKGERIVLSDAEIDRRLTEARKNVETWCK